MGMQNLSAFLSEGLGWPGSVPEVVKTRNQRIFSIEFACQALYKETKKRMDVNDIWPRCYEVVLKLSGATKHLFTRRRAKANPGQHLFTLKQQGNGFIQRACTNLRASRIKPIGLLDDQTFCAPRCECVVDMKNSQIIKGRGHAA